MTISVSVFKRIILWQMVNPASRCDGVSHAGRFKDLVALNVELEVAFDSILLIQHEVVRQRVAADFDGLSVFTW